VCCVSVRVGVGVGVGVLFCGVGISTLGMHSTSLESYPEYFVGGSPKEAVSSNRRTWDVKWAWQRLRCVHGKTRLQGESVDYFFREAL